MPRIKEKKKEYIMWAEAGVVSFAELIDITKRVVINPCVMTCSRTEEEYTDNEGLKRKRHVMHTEFFAYVYDAIFVQDEFPKWTLGQNVTILEAGTKFNQNLVDMYHSYINSVSAKKSN